jgi:hypothetical protein
MWSAALAGLLGLAGVAAAQTPGASLVIPVRVVEGHLMVVGYIANRAGDVNDLSLEVSFEHPGVLTLHGDQHAWLDAPAIVKLVLKPDVEVQLPGNEVRAESRPEREALHNALTRFHSNQLDEHKAKGVLGAGFLSKYRVVLDVAAGTLTLSPPESQAPPRGERVQDFELRDGRIWVPVSYADGRDGHMVLGGDWYDTHIDGALARELGKPAGNVEPMWLGEEGRYVDLSGQLAFRPGSMTGPVLVSGVNFLESFRVEVDWTGSQIAFTRTRQPEYPQADFDFFQAELDKSADAMQQYLRRHPESRLAPDAARALMQRRLQEAEVTDASLLAALQWVVDTSRQERRMENCVQYVNHFRTMPGRAALVVQAGKLALQHSREAVTVQDTYRLHNIIGEAYFEQDQVNDAWKHFLSAAFMPLDDRTDRLHNISVQYNLARAYDRMDRHTRAYSRYVRTRDMLEPIAEQLEGADEATIEGLAPALRMQVKLLKGAVGAVKEAVERLSKQIPPEELEMLEG